MEEENNKKRTVLETLANLATSINENLPSTWEKRDMEIRIELDSDSLYEVDKDLFYATKPDTEEFKHSDVVIANIDGIRFKLEEKQKGEE